MVPEEVAQSGLAQKNCYKTTFSGEGGGGCDYKYNFGNENE